MDLGPIIGAYAMVTALVVMGAALTWGNGDLKGNPIAYVLWPIIALTACIVTVKRMWREG